MSTNEDPLDAVVPAVFDHELAMVRAGILLVADGRSRRVVLSNLRFAEALLPEARRLAEASRVRVVPLWTTAEHSRDLAIEPWPGDD